MIFETKENNKNKEILIVNGYCNTPSKVRKCLGLLKTLGQFENDILYVSSCEIDPQIINEVDFAFFQKRNWLAESNRLTFMDNMFLLAHNRKGKPTLDEPYLVTRNLVHDSGLAQADLIFQGIQIAQGLGYGYFHSLTYDITHDYDEIGRYLTKSSDMLRNKNKEGYFIQHSEQQKDKEGGLIFKYTVTTLIVFSGNVDFFNQDYLIRKFSTYGRFDEINEPKKLVTKYWCGEHFSTACLQDYFNFNEFHLEEDDFGPSFRSQCTDTHIDTLSRQHDVDRLVYNEPSDEIFIFLTEDPAKTVFKINDSTVSPVVTPRIYHASSVNYPDQVVCVFWAKLKSVNMATYTIGAYSFINDEFFRKHNLVKTPDNSLEDGGEVANLEFL